MDYTKIDGLITSAEHKQLYELQCDTINSEAFSENEKLLRLAIMQTIRPRKNWEPPFE